MQVSTTRFGRISVCEGDIITFPRGLLGFPAHKRFVAPGAVGPGGISWLQCVDDAGLAFVVAEPFEYFRDLDVPLELDAQLVLQLADPAAAQVLVICNAADGWLTANLLGPVVINPKNRLGWQVALADNKKWSTRQPVLPLRSVMARAA